MFLSNHKKRRRLIENSEPGIVKCDIGPYPKDMFSPMPEVKATFNDGSTKVLFDFYPDEISFCEQELIGLTESQAHELKYHKDLKYLKA